MRDRSTRRATRAAAACATAAGIVYLFTLSPSVGYVDSGALATAAWTFGVPPPPGYPLYVLLAGLWVGAFPLYHALASGALLGVLPDLSVIRVLNAFSAVCSATGLFFFARALRLILGQHCPNIVDTDGADREAASASGMLRDSTALLFASMLGVWTLGFSPTWWNVSLITETYALALCLIAACLWIFLSCFLDEGLAPGRRMKRAHVGALLFGLALSAHPMAAVLLPMLLLLHLRRFGVRRAGWLALGKALPFFLAGLLPYVLLAVRARSGPAMNWGDPSTLGRFIEHVTGAQFRGALFASWDIPLLQAEYFADRFPAEFGYALAPLLLVGVVSLFRRNAAAGWAVALLFLTACAWAIQAPLLDVGPHFLPAYMAIAAFLAAGMHAVLSARRRWLAFIGTLSMLGAIGLHAASGYTQASERGSHAAEDYARNIFESLRPGAVVISDEWPMFISPSLFLQAAGGRAGAPLRPDVVVIDARLTRRPWYLAQLQRRAPAVMGAAKPEIDEYLAILARRARGEAVAAATLAARHDAILTRIIETSLPKRPVCVTAAMDAIVPVNCDAIPEGMVLRVYPLTDSLAPVTMIWDDFVTRPPGRVNEYDRLVEGRYFRMLARRGYWLYAQGRRREAEGYFERASGFRQFDASERWRAWKLALEAASSPF